MSMYKHCPSVPLPMKNRSSVSGRQWVKAVTIMAACMIVESREEIIRILISTP